MKSFKKKTETGSIRQISVRFGYFKKTRFKPVWLNFLVLARFFQVWLFFFRFFLFKFGLIFLFHAYKTKTKCSIHAFMWSCISLSIWEISPYPIYIRLAKFGQGHDLRLTMHAHILDVFSIYYPKNISFLFLFSPWFCVRNENENPYTKGEFKKNFFFKKSNFKTQWKTDTGFSMVETVKSFKSVCSWEV